MFDGGVVDDEEKMLECISALREKYLSSAFWSFDLGTGLWMWRDGVVFVCVCVIQCGCCCCLVLLVLLLLISV
jgi:hypothetical protein